MTGGMLRVHGIVNDSIVDGPGLRLAVFTQGCFHGCSGCHNPASHDPAGGRFVSVGDILDMARNNPLLSGLTLTGGEPLEQAASCLALAQAFSPHGSVWLYSGYTFEAIMDSGDPARIGLVKACDVLVDGPFKQAERSLDLTFRGSRNQRLIDIKTTLAQGRVVLWEPPSFG